MFNPKTFENSRPDGIGVLEIVDEAEREQEQPKRFVPLRRTELGGEIVGPLASMRLSQTYCYSRAECDKVLEAVYRFPLPGDAAVTGVRAKFGDVEIVAELKERTKAETSYQEAKQEGRQAALLTRESPDVFTLQVAGIQPDQDVTIETSYVQLARAEGPGWSLRIPLTTSPRYVRGDEAGSRHAQGQPLMLLRDPGHRFALDLTFPATSEVKSPTHSLNQTNEDGRSRLRLQEGEVIPDRDCVLNWQPAQESERPTFGVSLHEDRQSGQVYFLGLLAPPKRKATSGVPREVILLVDHSGSMKGPKWEAADWAVKRFLGDLNEHDRFSLGLFHDKTTWFDKAPRTADTKSVAKAISFLDRSKDDGGTELGVALEQALASQRSTGEMARHVLIITDAEVSDAGRILRLADTESKEAQRRRIDVLCIDAAPNSFLARELAERGGGVAKFLTSAPDEEDITTALDEVLVDWTQPVVSDLRLVVNREGVEASGHAVFNQAVDLGDLPAGRAIWVVGRVPRGQGDELSFKVMTPANREVGGVRVNLNGERHERPALKALFGARRVSGLEYLVTSGYEEKEFEEQLSRLGYEHQQVLADRPEAKSKVYAENAREDASKRLNRLLVREASHYGLACSETAFVAVRREAGKLVEGTVAVANALPSGWSQDFETSLSMSRGAGAMFCMADTLSADSMLMDFDDAASPPPQANQGVLSRLSSFAGKTSRLMSGGAVSAPVAHATEAGQKMLFDGIPAFEKGESLLFDTDRAEDSKQLPDDTTFVQLRMEFPDGVPNVDEDLMLLLFVDDMAAPRARVRLSDLIRQNGERPLNLRRRSGQRLRMLLMDRSGTWAKSAPAIRVSLHWE